MTSTDELSPMQELTQLLDEENADDWDFDANDDVRMVLIEGHIVIATEYWAGGHWATDDPHPTPRADRIIGLLSKLSREELTQLTLDLSLCPIHLVDYAICFDDQDAACASIRLIHPAHDT